MSEAGIERALELLHQAAREVRALQAAFDERDVLVSISAPALPELIAELVQVTKRKPSWHLGHLSMEEFEAVRQRLEASSVELSVHENGDRYLIIEETRCGLVIRAQTTAPPASAAAAEPDGPIQEAPL